MLSTFQNCSQNLFDQPVYLHKRIFHKSMLRHLLLATRLDNVRHMPSILYLPS